MNNSTTDVMKVVITDSNTDMKDKLKSKRPNALFAYFRFNKDTGLISEWPDFYIR